MSGHYAAALSDAAWSYCEGTGDEEHTYNLFDAVLCFTDALYNDDSIRDVAGLDAVERTLKR